jgi:hypothetical protein
VGRPPSLIPKQRPKRPGDLPVVVSRGTNWNGSCEPEYLTACLDKLRESIAGLISYQFAKGKRHGFDDARCM